MAEAVGLTTKVPLRVSLPLQAPEAVQLTAFVEDQVKVLLPPVTIELALAVKVTVGAAAAMVTFTIVDWVAVPPAPVQDKV